MRDHRLPLSVGRLLRLSGRALAREPGVMWALPAGLYGIAAGLTYIVSLFCSVGWTWLVWGLAVTAVTSFVVGDQVMRASLVFPGGDPSVVTRRRDRWRTAGVVWLLAAMLVPLIPFVWVMPWYWHIIMTTPSGSSYEDMRPVSMLALVPVSVLAVVLAVAVVVSFGQALPAAACEGISPGRALIRVSQLARFRGSFALFGVGGSSSVVLIIVLLMAGSIWHLPFGITLAVGGWLGLTWVEPMASALVAGLYMDARRFEYDRYLAWTRSALPTR